MELTDNTLKTELTDKKLKREVTENMENPAKIPTMPKKENALTADQNDQKDL